MHFGILFLLLTPPMVAIGLTKYRSDYRRHGHTTLLGVAGAFLAFLMPHLVLGSSFPMIFIPHTTVEIVGMSIMALGLLGCFWALRHFSRGMWTGRRQAHLVTSGPYRYSRNPQYVTYFLFPAGYALIGRTVLAWVALVLYWIVTHLIVLIEEEHLERRFGDVYRRYRRNTPRYLFW